MEEWFVDEYARDSELCKAVKLNIDDEESCWEYENCLHCPYYTNQCTTE